MDRIIKCRTIVVPSIKHDKAILYMESPRTGKWIRRVSDTRCNHLQHKEIKQSDAYFEGFGKAYLYMWDLTLDGFENSYKLRELIALKDNFQKLLTEWADSVDWD